MVSSIDLTNRYNHIKTTTPSQSGAGSNGNEEVLHIPQISKAEASPSYGLMSYTGQLMYEGNLFSIYLLQLVYEICMLI